VDAVAAADRDRILVLEGAGLERGEQPVHVGDQQVGCAHELDVKAGIENVRRRHALVDEAGLRADVLSQMRQEGDHIMFRNRLDGVDPVDVEDGGRTFFPYPFCRSLRNNSEFCGSGRGMGLDFKPDSKACCGFPNAGHLGAGVAGDHASKSLMRCRRRNRASAGHQSKCAQLGEKLLIMRNIGFCCCAANALQQIVKN
jgi:hypothetical protein